jgi:putative transcriptional regulator
MGRLRIGILLAALLLGGGPGAAVQAPVVGAPSLAGQLLVATPELEIRVHYGGPVEPGRGVMLHSPDYRQDDPLVVDHLAAFSFSLDALRDIAVGHGPRQSLFALGYAGWAPDQLEGEIAGGSWFTIAPDAALLFDDAIDTKWQRALARGGVDL